MGAGDSAYEVAQRKRAKARQLEIDARRWEQGAEGERQIAGVLTALPPEYAVFHDLRLPDSKANVDHLVVAPHGIFAIDTKNFTHAVTLGRGRGADRLWTGGRSIRLHPCRFEATTVASLVGVDVTPTMCIIAPSLPDSNFDFDGVWICAPTRLKSMITTGGARVIDVPLVAERVTAIFGVRPEIRDPQRVPEQPLAQLPAKARQPSPRRQSRAARQGRSVLHSWWFQLVFRAATVLVFLALLPTFVSVFTRVATEAVTGIGNDVATRTVASTSTTTTTTPIGDPPAVPLDASCPNPGGGWIISFGWPGELPAAVASYSIRWQADDGPIVRHDAGGWSDPTEQPASIVHAHGTSLNVMTDYLDAAGRVLATTPQTFETSEPC